MLSRPTIAALAAMTSLLAACGEGGNAAPAKTDQATAPLPAAITGSMRPGLYRVAQTGDVEIEDERCVTPEDVAAGRFVPPEDMQEGWTASVNRASEGRIAVAARHPGGGRMTISGSYGPDSFFVEGELSMTVNGEPHRIRTTQRGTLLSTSCEGEFAVDS